MSYTLKHYYVADDGNIILTGEFGDKREFESKDAAVLVALDAVTTWVKLGTFICSIHEGVAVVCQNDKRDEMLSVVDSVMEFPAIFGVSPLHKLTYRASAIEYRRAVDQLCETGACEWEDLGTGRRYRYSDETQKHIRLESLQAAA